LVKGEEAGQPLTLTPKVGAISKVVVSEPNEISEKLTFQSLPRKQESRNALKILDSCLRKNDGIASLGGFSEISKFLLDRKRQGFIMLYE